VLPERARDVIRDEATRGWTGVAIAVVPWAVACLIVVSPIVILERVGQVH
jgi:hypothetical protein